MKTIKETKISILKKDSKKGFSLLAGINRPITPGHVTKIAKLIEKCNIATRPVVIAIIDFLDGKPVPYIVDGQHLYTACLRLNIDIPFLEVEIKDIVHLVEIIALQNSSSKSWSIMDYVNSWKIVNKDYIVLNDLYNRYDIELLQLAELLYRTSINCYKGGGNSVMSRIIKTGEFKIKDLDMSIDILNKITDVLKIVPRMDRFSNKLFIATLSSYILTPKYNHKLTLNYISKNKDKFLTVTQDPDKFIELLEQIK